MLSKPSKLSAHTTNSSKERSKQAPGLAANSKAGADS